MFFSRSLAAVCAFLLALVSASSSQTFTTLKNFTATTEQTPALVLLAQGRDGMMYGTTESGAGSFMYGTVFEQNTAGIGTAVLYTFGWGADGGFPAAGLTLARNGNFYGTSNSAGANGTGTLFEITTSGIITTLYSFPAGGGLPTAPPIEASDGNFYGTTLGSDDGYSTLYKYSPSLGTVTTLYVFPYGDFEAEWPPVQGSDGDLYVSVAGDGSHNCGYIGKFSTAGILKGSYSFTCKAGGGTPRGAVVQGPDGSLYGTAQTGGANGLGNVYKLDLAANIFTVLHNFGATSDDGEIPLGGVTMATDGNLYGSTELGGTFNNGTLFQVTPTGGYTQLYSLPTVHGQGGYSAIVVPPVQHTNGLLYGVTNQGGAEGWGSVYSLDMGLGPFVKCVGTQGASGATAQILGQGLTGTTAVSFNGVSASSFSVVSDTFMTAVVPAGATTGPVEVSTPSGVLSSNMSFKIIH